MTPTQAEWFKGREFYVLKSGDGEMIGLISYDIYGDKWHYATVRDISLPREEGDRIASHATDSRTDAMLSIMRDAREAGFEVNDIPTEYES